MLVQAYEYRGRAYYGIGLQEKASENFRLIVLLKPDHALSKEQVSPKIVDLFNSVKKALVGYLAVSSEPAGAQVTLVGTMGDRRELALTDFFPLEVLAGEYTVEVSKEGYRTETRPLSIAATVTETMDVPLERVLASVFFVTQPADVEVWIDGELRVTTSGVLAPDQYDRARSNGLDPTRASSRVEIPNLSLGSHTVEFRRECFETLKRTLQTPVAQDYDLEPVRLEDSIASLRLASDPPGARIYINGEARGVTPSQIDGICTGKVRVEVKHAAGKFIKDLVLAKDEALSLDCPIRPTLAFLGVEAETSAGDRYREEAAEKIFENLSRLTSVNFIERPERGGEPRSPARGGQPRRPFCRTPGASRTSCAGSATGWPRPWRSRASSWRSCPRSGCSAPPGSTCWRRATPPPRSWTWSSASRPRTCRPRAARPALLQPADLERADHRGHPDRRGRARPAGGRRAAPRRRPASSPGTVSRRSTGSRSQQTAEILAAVAAKKPRGHLAVHVQGSGGRPGRGAGPGRDRAGDPPVRSAAALQPGDGGSARGGGRLPRAPSRRPTPELNLALCAMHFGDFAGAHDSLQKAKAELPERPGLSRGTALYYLGVALERLGYAPQAREAYRAAAAATEATLIDNDGPAVAPLAARRAEQ